MGESDDYRALYEEAKAVAVFMGVPSTDSRGRVRTLAEMLRMELHALEHLRHAHQEWGEAYDRQRARADKAEAELKMLRRELAELKGQNEEMDTEEDGDMGPRFD